MFLETEEKFSTDLLKKYKMTEDEDDSVEDNMQSCSPDYENHVYGIRSRSRRS